MTRLIHKIMRMPGFVMPQAPRMPVIRMGKTDLNLPILRRFRKRAGPRPGEIASSGISDPSLLFP